MRKVPWEREIEIKFDLLSKYIHCVIEKGGYSYRFFDDLFDYGFWYDVHYEGDIFHYTLDGHRELNEKKEIKYLRLKPKIGSGLVYFDITKEELEYLKYSLKSK